MKRLYELVLQELKTTFKGRKKNKVKYEVDYNVIKLFEVLLKYIDVKSENEDVNNKNNVYITDLKFRCVDDDANDVDDDINKYIDVDGERYPEKEIMFFNSEFETRNKDIFIALYKEKIYNAVMKYREKYIDEIEKNKKIESGEILPEEMYLKKIEAGEIK